MIWRGEAELKGRGCNVVFFFQAEDGIRDAQESRGLGDVYKRQAWRSSPSASGTPTTRARYSTDGGVTEHPGVA